MLWNLATARRTAARSPATSAVDEAADGLSATSAEGVVGVVLALQPTQIETTTSKKYTAGKRRTEIMRMHPPEGHAGTCNRRAHPAATLVRDGVIIAPCQC